MNLSNYSFNVSAALKPECIAGGRIDAVCIYQHICKDISQHFQKWGLILIVAYVIIDFIIPVVLTQLENKGVLERLNGLLAQHLSIKLDLSEWRGFVLFLKDKLLFAFALLVAYQLFL